MQVQSNTIVPFATEQQNFYNQANAYNTTPPSAYFTPTRDEYATTTNPMMMKEGGMYTTTTTAQGMITTTMLSNPSPVYFNTPSVNALPQNRLEMFLTQSNKLVIRRDRALEDSEDRRYYIANESTQTPEFFAGEHSTRGAKLAYGSKRPLTVKLVDYLGNQYIEIDKPYKTHHKTVDVVNSEKIKIGSIEKHFGLVFNKYKVMSTDKQYLFSLKSTNVNPNEFKIKCKAFSGDKSVKHDRGLVSLSDLKDNKTADNVTMTFPATSSPFYRTLILSAVFFIEFSLHWD